MGRSVNKKGLKIIAGGVIFGDMKRFKGKIFPFYFGVRDQSKTQMVKKLADFPNGFAGGMKMTTGRDFSRQG